MAENQAEMDQAELVKSVNLIMRMAQSRMKQSLGIDPGKMN